MKAMYYHLWALGYCLLLPLIDRLVQIRDICWRRASYHAMALETMDKDRE